jgi:hypothetical protein
MSNIPEARRRLIAMANYYDGTRTGKELANIVLLLAREPSIRRAKISSAKATKGLKQSIQLYAKENPETKLSDIANMFNVNIGRVSEALRK